MICPNCNCELDFVLKVNKLLIDEETGKPYPYRNRFETKEDAEANTPKQHNQIKEEVAKDFPLKKKYKKDKRKEDDK